MDESLQSIFFSDSVWSAPTSPAEQIEGDFSTRVKEELEGNDFKHSALIVGEGGRK